ncbi:MAG: pitrilysin family protein [Pseudomonadota bacterium]
MFYKITMAFVFWFGVGIQAHAFSGDAVPQISSYQLENGVKLVVIPDRRAPVVTHMIWYEVGSADDPVGKSGISHFLEHLLFKGTANVPQGEFSGAVASIGGQENAFTSYDYTAYYQKVSPNALPLMMRYEADRMRNVVLSDEVVYPERKVILEERSSRVDSNPSSILSEFVQAALFVHHPYGVPIIGWEHEIEKLEREDILAFYEQWYQPWNAIVVVAGDVDPENVYQLAKDSYGKVKATQPEVERKRNSDPVRVVSKSITYRDTRVTNPVWQRTFVVPSYRTDQGLESEALDILASILGQSVSSRIYKNLVIRNEMATGAGAYYQGTAIDEGYFGLYATPRGDTTVEELEAAMESQIDTLLSQGVTKEELDRARRTLIQSVVFSQDSQVTMARIFGSVLATGGTIEDVTEWTKRLEQVTVEELNAVARKYLVRDKAVTSYLLPETQ